MKALFVLGSTGSIGTQTLEIVREEPGTFQVEALAANGSWEKVLEQVREFHPRVVAMADAEAAEELRGHLPEETALRAGPDAVLELAAEAEYDLAVHGIVGAAGVRPSAAILGRGKDLALANKESLVVAGDPLMELARSRDAMLFPVDSEHAAVFQCLLGEDVRRVRRILLTASGGALRDVPLSELGRTPPEQALRHPNWDMGPRITIGSATLMNKALEVIEAHHLFGLGHDQIDVVLHRQSLVHAMVELVDGSVLAQMGPPDMRGPIHQALHHPERRPSSLQGFDTRLFRELTFSEVDPERFPALELGYECVRRGGATGAFLNAADEVAVAAYLAGEIEFQDIVRVDRRVLEKTPSTEADVDSLLRADTTARDLAQREVEACKTSTTRA